MDRITTKLENGFYHLKPKASIYGEENGIRLVQIVGNIEDLMEKYEITSFEALEEIIKDYDDMARDIVRFGLGELGFDIDEVVKNDNNN